MSYNKEYYQQNREMFLNASRAWHERNPDYAHNWYLANRVSNLTATREWRLQNKDRTDYLNKRNYQLNRDERCVYAKQWAEENPEKIIAENMIKNGIRNGKIQRGESCSVCGKIGRIEAHHEDYSKPLEVIWTCRSCHKKIHVGVLI